MISAQKTQARIDTARNELQHALAELEEAKGALAQACEKARRGLVRPGGPGSSYAAREALQARSLSVDRAAAYLAALLAIEKAITVVPAIETLCGDLALIEGVHRRAASLGAAPVHLTTLLTSIDADVIAEIAPQATQAAHRQASVLVERLKRDPFARL